MNLFYSIIILIIFISCSKSDRYDNQYSPLQRSSEILDQNLTIDIDDGQLKYKIIRYKTNFICHPPKEKVSSHKEIHAYIHNSNLIFRSKSRSLIKATDLFYSDDFDLEAYITYPNYTTSQVRGFSFLTIPLTPTIGCIDRVEVTLVLGDHPIVY